jgi:hypothetical protein
MILNQREKFNEIIRRRKKKKKESIVKKKSFKNKNIKHYIDYIYFHI